MKYVASLMLLFTVACNDVTGPMKYPPKAWPNLPVPVDTVPTDPYAAAKAACAAAKGTWNERRTVEIYVDSLGVTRERYIPGCMYTLP